MVVKSIEMWTISSIIYKSSKFATDYIILSYPISVTDIWRNTISTVDPLTSRYILENKKLFKNPLKIT